MLACGYLACYLCCGILMIRWLLPRHPALNRIWLGASLGLLLMMWLPALLAFALRFSLAAHLAALGLLLLLTAGTYCARDRRDVRRFDAEEKRQLRQLLFLVVPLTAFSGYLQYTHVMRVAADGSWHVGQSTYGDLPMHLSFITSLKDASFPADYSFFPATACPTPFWQTVCPPVSTCWA